MGIYDGLLSPQKPTSRAHEPTSRAHEPMSHAHERVVLLLYCLFVFLYFCLFALIYLELFILVHIRSSWFIGIFQSKLERLRLQLYVGMDGIGWDGYQVVGSL